jgi:glutaconate CoA-transferase subunit B
VVTDLGVYHFGEDGEMAITSLHPDVTPDDVRRNTGWDIVIPDDVPATPAPTQVELRVLREDLDPNGYYLKGERGQ